MPVSPTKPRSFENAEDKAEIWKEFLDHFDYQIESEGSDKDVTVSLYGSHIKEFPNDEELREFMAYAKIEYEKAGWVIWNPIFHYDIPSSYPPIEDEKSCIRLLNPYNENIFKRKINNIAKKLQNDESRHDDLTSDKFKEIPNLIIEELELKEDPYFNINNENKSDETEKEIEKL